MWLLVGYVLPYTVWHRLSARALLENALRDAPPLATLGLAGGLFTAVWWLFRRDAQADSWAFALWLMLAVWASAYLFDPPGRGYTGVEAVRCALVLNMATVGMLVARLLKPVNLMQVVVALASVQAVYALWYYFAGRNLFYTHAVARAGGTFGTPVHVYILMMLALPMALALLGRHRSRWARAGLWIAMAVMLGTLWLTYSRSAWLATGVAIPLMVWSLWQRRRLAIALAVFFALTLAGMYLLRLAGHPQFQDTTAEARVEVWRMGWELFARHWLWGVGADHVRLQYTSTWRGYAVSTWYGAPENQLLLWLCERGIWGGALGIMVVMALWRRFRELSPPLRWGMGGALLALGVLSMFQSVFGRVEEGMETVLVTAIWSAILRKEATSDEALSGVLTT